jgi:sulfur-oxidizing protein SoxX
MKLKNLAVLSVVAGGLFFASNALAGDCPGVETSDASQIIKKDIPPDPRIYAIPENCKLDNPKFVEKMAKEGQKIFNDRKIANCVACHNAPGSVNAGDIGPDLTGYMSGLYNAPKMLFIFFPFGSIK